MLWKLVTIYGTYTYMGFKELTDIAISVSSLKKTMAFLAHPVVLVWSIESFQELLDEATG